MGRTACTEPQCLYKSALYLYFIEETVYPFYPAIQFHTLWQDFTYPHIPAIIPSSLRAKLHFGTQLCGHSNLGNECRNTALQLSRPVHAVTHGVGNKRRGGG